ncbi:site-specific integrase [Glycomyces tritici]|uniref:Site-specific integrase n=1 Tax=Glycomyces tritici TaxID=2665176 RepID=A0ABT7YQF7_9ACTN|nr:site-specific integrase [Glycomyces tritici]MDN3240854.1 site-specific integrase [Glycomyces tritici]
MSKPKSKGRYGEGTVFWDKRRGRWVARVSAGIRPDGTRDVRVAEGHTPSEAQDRLNGLKAEVSAGVEGGVSYTVAQACEDWLKYGLKRQSERTKIGYSSLVNANIVPLLGRARLKKLRAEDVDHWLAQVAKDHANTTITLLLGLLRRIIRFAEARGKVLRNVAELVDAPEGTAGRPSKSMTIGQAQALLEASRGHWIHGYIALSVFTGVRTEEARPLKWKHTHLNPVAGQDCTCGERHRETAAPHVEVWRSVRNKGETKTPKSRRTIALPRQVVMVLTAVRAAAEIEAEDAGHTLRSESYVFPSEAGTVRDAANVRRDFRKVVTAAGIEGEWTPREFRHTFVSIMSDAGVREELIANLVGHKRTSTTRTVYRHQLRPVITTGAEVLDELFDLGPLGH